MASGFAFSCDYCGKVQMHRGQAPTVRSDFQQLGVGGGYVEPNPPSGWIRVLEYRGGVQSSIVGTFCGSTCAMGRLAAAELEASNG